MISETYATVTDVLCVVGCCGLLILLTAIGIGHSVRQMEKTVERMSNRLYDLEKENEKLQKKLETIRDDVDCIKYNKNI